MKSRFESTWLAVVGPAAARQLWASLLVQCAILAEIPIFFVALLQPFVSYSGAGYRALGAIFAVLVAFLAALALWRRSHAKIAAAHYVGLPRESARHLNINSPTLFRASVEKEGVRVSAAPSPQTLERDDPGAWSDVLEPRALAHRRRATFFFTLAIVLLVCGICVAVPLAFLSPHSTLIVGSASILLVAVLWVLGSRQLLSAVSATRAQYRLSSETTLTLRSLKSFRASLEIAKRSSPDK